MLSVKKQRSRGCKQQGDNADYSCSFYLQTPVRVVLKDERPTSNIERSTLNKKTNTEYCCRLSVTGCR